MKTGIIGLGKMGGALLRGMLGSFLVLLGSVLLQSRVQIGRAHV